MNSINARYEGVQGDHLVKAKINNIDLFKLNGIEFLSLKLVESINEVPSFLYSFTTNNITLIDSIIEDCDIELNVTKIPNGEKFRYIKGRVTSVTKTQDSADGYTFYIYGIIKGGHEFIHEVTNKSWKNTTAINAMKDIFKSLDFNPSGDDGGGKQTWINLNLTHKDMITHLLRRGIVGTDPFMFGLDCESNCVIKKFSTIKDEKEKAILVTNEEQKIGSLPNYVYSVVENFKNESLKASILGGYSRKVTNYDYKKTNDTNDYKEILDYDKFSFSGKSRGTYNRNSQIMITGINFGNQHSEFCESPLVYQSYMAHISSSSVVVEIPSISIDLKLMDKVMLYDYKSPSKLQPPLLNSGIYMISGLDITISPKKNIRWLLRLNRNAMDG